VLKMIGAEVSRIPAGDTEIERYFVFQSMDAEVSRIPAGDTEKMQIPVGSPEEGTVKKVFVTPDQFLNEGDSIVELG
jgi:multidrug efflux pump subunit AcrA (membrane-fusion protein)